ncbi:MAG: methyltransferase domain-containing protein [Planctomycetota bacterium]
MLSTLKHRFRLMRGKAKAQRLAQSKHEIWLNLGAGRVRGRDGWTTVDWNKRCDVYWDLTCKLPFPNDRVSRIYTSHTLEHLTFGETQSLLRECHRILRVGGELSVCVPNARFYIDAYIEGREIDTSKVYAPAWNFLSPIDVVNYTAYMNGEHKHLFDQDNLVAVLAKAGFADSAAREFDDQTDIKSRDYASIYASASKQKLSDPLRKAA